jgi:hypothetical protein
MCWRCDAQLHTKRDSRPCPDAHALTSSTPSRSQSADQQQEIDKQSNGPIVLNAMAGPCMGIDSTLAVCTWHARDCFTGARRSACHRHGCVGPTPSLSSSA